MSGAQDSPVGHIGVIVVATRGDAGPGEVEIRIRGGNETFLARSDEPLAVGTDVIVISATGSRTLLVYPVDEADDVSVETVTDDPRTATDRDPDEPGGTSLDLSEGE